jgi:presenilin-like A22 family membrane protease
MVTMAKFAKSANLFPGLAVTYNEKTGKIKTKKNTEQEIIQKKNVKTSKIRTGILGGGDIAFPMIFAATFLIFLLNAGYSNAAAIGYSLIISLFAGISLMLLFLYGKKDSYYPAMPFISAGCFIGYIISIILIQIL